ncbi:DUF2075 domain-containing protein [Paenibacillus sp. 7124]|uniref:DUF2075 domain-containing protein n=1 Tax=Paenibacillus apii TaxID=1850370 RepID=A0A6M1PL64_9BACL|nr:DNA/RNA helicase domain-containing protein [Paenibacillus apii]NGM83956.1 DUF2075 domain-containing protein [Paenibacillus apii]
MKTYGWKGSIIEFIQEKPEDIVHELCLYVYEQPETELRNHNQEHISQVDAWYDSITFLRGELEQLAPIEGALIWEYSLPREKGRRPDVLVLLPGELLVLEFKRYVEIHESEYNQASFYVRDLKEYHSAVQECSLKVRGALVITQELSYPLQGIEAYQIYRVGRGGLAKLIHSVIAKSDGTLPIVDQEFVEGIFQPLPSIIESAKSIMRNEPLPVIRSIKSSNFESVLQEVVHIAEQAEQEGSHHLVLVAGVPGAGKTYVGLTLAHELQDAVYVSGNGPLVDVLQDTLKTKAFVQSLYGYKMDYLNRRKVPKEHIIIFDEAQRAWDATQMKRDVSEPEVIIEIAQTKPWSVVVGLIGTGQHIHLGEERGISLWNVAIRDKQVFVHGKDYKDQFPHTFRYIDHSHLHLNVSLRTHAAAMYHEWVELLLEGQFEQCRELKKTLQAHRYTIKHMERIEDAIQYVQRMYEGTNKTYGVVLSSGARAPSNLQHLPKAERYQRPIPHVAYYNYPDSAYYCRNLRYGASEFQVQGLELDMAILYWGEDLMWTSNGWSYKKLRTDANHPEQLKQNAYRVLLTRGRDGIIIVDGPRM